MELHIRAYQIGHDIDNRRTRDIVPVDRVMLDRVRHPSQPRRIRRVPRFKIEDLVGCAYLARALHHFLGGGAKLRDPFVADHPLEQDVAFVEIELTR